MTNFPNQSEYFFFFPHVQFVRGAKGGVLHDLFASDVFWFRNPVIAGALSKLALHASIDESASSVNISSVELLAYLQLIHRLGLGDFAPRPVAVEAYRPGLLRSKAEQHSLQRRGGTATIEISNACLFNCHFCTSKNTNTLRACSCGVWETTGAAVATQRLLRTLRLLHFAGIDRLVVRGGEPFLMPDRLWPLIEEANALSMQIELHSTGMTIDQSVVDKLADLRATLHLMIPDTLSKEFDSIVGRTGAFEKLNETLKNLCEAGVAFFAKIPAEPTAVNSAYDIAEWALEMGATGIEFLWYAPSHWSPSQLQSVLGPHGPDDMGVNVGEFINNAQSHSCFDNQVFISFEGEITPCIGIRHGVATLKKDPFDVVAREKLLKDYDQKSRNNTQACRACEFRMGCKGCLVRTKEITGSFDSRHGGCNYSPDEGIWIRRY